MTQRTFAVLGATGHVGQVLTAELLARGHKVRALARSLKKLEPLQAKGAVPVPVSGSNMIDLGNAFFDCDGVFAMIPPDYDAEDHDAYQDRIGESIREALLHAKVKKVLNLSSMGAQHAEGTGPVRGLYRQEQRLNGMPAIDVLHLRPTFFMQNFFWQIPTIRQRGVVSSALSSDLPMWMVSTSDIGKKAAEILDALSFSGKSVFEFVGPQELSQSDAAQILGRAIGRPELKYVQASYADEERAMLSAGMRPGTVTLMVELHQGFNEGLFRPTQKLDANHCGSTTLETFAAGEFAPAFKKFA